MAIAKQLFVALNQNGVSPSFQRFENVQFEIGLHRIGVAIRINTADEIDKIMKMMTFNNSFTEPYYWLIVIDQQYENLILSKICKLPLRLDTDLTLAIENQTEINRRVGLLERGDINGVISIFERPEIDPAWNLVAPTTPVFHSEDLFVNGETIGIKRTNVNFPVTGDKSFYDLIQIYKIRTDLNKSCVVSLLGRHSFRGFFARKNSLVERRTNMHKFPLYVAGIDYRYHLANSSEDWSEEKQAMDYFTTYFMDVLNSRFVRFFVLLENSIYIYCVWWALKSVLNKYLLLFFVYEGRTHIYSSPMLF